MRVLFTRSGNIVSRMIRWVTKEPVSHCALQVGGYVVHSNFLGVHAQTVDSFEGACTVYASITYPDNYPRIFDQLCAHGGAWYDFGAMLYIAARAICPWLPKKNLWRCSGMFLCTEWVTDFLGETDSMITPWQLFLKLGGVPPGAVQAGATTWSSGTKV
jgi:hypothetical protein